MVAILSLVAINTLLFLGLSVAKVMPWPEPLHPRTLRARVRADHPSHQGPRSPERGSLRQELLLSTVVALRRLGGSSR